MAEPAKFLFDRSFAPPSKVTKESAAEHKLKAEHEAQLAEARKTAFEKGRVEGERAARATLEADISRTLTALLGHAQCMQSELGSECDAIHAHAVQVALRVAERLARELLRCEPLAEIEAMFADCLGHLPRTPHIAVRVSEALAEPARRRLEEIAAGQGFMGQLFIHGDAGIEIGDCRIEWAEGGVTRNFQATLDSIQQAIDRHLAARQREWNLREGKAGPADGPQADSDGSGERQ